MVVRCHFGRVRVVQATHSNSPVSFMLTLDGPRTPAIYKRSKIPLSPSPPQPEFLIPPKSRTISVTQRQKRKPYRIHTLHRGTGIKNQQRYRNKCPPGKLLSCRRVTVSRPAWRSPRYLLAYGILLRVISRRRIIATFHFPL